MADFTWVPTQVPSIETFLGFELQAIPVIPGETHEPFDE